jgi:tetratricopeptide (TPR) repeat protein
VVDDEWAASRHGGGEDRERLGAPGAGAEPSEPVHHPVLAFDIEEYGRQDRNDSIRGALRHRLHGHLDAAMRHAGIAPPDRSVTDLGDGALLLLKPHISKRRLLDTMLPRLAVDLAADNARAGEREQLRLRAVVHAGELIHDRTGAYGQDLNHAFRLLDAPVLRRRLAEVGASLAVIVSQAIYDGIVRHGHKGIDPAVFTRVTVAVKETRATAWIWVPTAERPAPPRPAPPQAIGNLPRLNPRFVGRERELAEIERLLTAQRGRRLPVALHGLPTVGKSALALEYAHRHAAAYDLVWWVRADHRTSVLADLAELARSLGAPRGGHRALAAGLTAQLARFGRWLLIFDDAARPQDLDDCLPAAANGDVLITTWSREFRLTVTSLEVEPFSPADAQRFLCDRTGSVDLEAAARLAHAFGYLPLALDQAAAYVTRAGLTLDHYLELYELHRDELVRMGLDDGHEQASIESRLRGAFERLERHTPAAAQLAMLLSFVAPVTVPDDLVTSVADLLPDPLAGMLGHEPTYLQRARGTLILHSLAEPERHGLRMHSLVQAAIRRHLSRPAQQVWAGHAVRMLLREWPFDPQNPSAWPRCAALAGHAVAASRLADQLDAAPEETASLLRTVGVYHMEQAGPVTTGTELPLAREQLERALAILETTCRPDDPEIALTLMHLGRALRRLDRPQDARAALERAVRILESAPGRHAALPSVLTHLAQALRDLGDHAGARDLLRDALRRYEAEPSTDVGKLAWVLAHLGRVQRRLGNHAGARETLRRALKLVDDAGRRCDHHIAALLIQLGRVLRRLGDYGAAAAVLERALLANQAVFGPRHHRTAEVLIHIGALLRDQGHLAEARARLELAFEINVAAYGPSHHTTARARAHLGRVLRRMEELPRAREMLERALADVERARGRDHPQVAWTLVHLSTVLQAQGLLDRARAVLERALTITERTYPPGHPDVAWILTHLAAVTILHDPRRRVAADAALERALSITENAYGKDHLDVAWVLTHVGTAFQRAGRLEEAKGLLERALAIIERAAAGDGQPHRLIVPTLTALGQTLGALGQAAQAAARLKAVIAIASVRLGPHHPETRAAWRALEDVDADIEVGPA